MAGKDPIHMLRYMKYQAMTGSPEERLLELAKEEKVNVEAVRKSIRNIEIYRSSTSGSEMDYAIRDIVISVAPKAKETIIGLLDATEMVEVPVGNTGQKKLVKQPDKTTRIEGVKLVSDLIGKMQPKQSPVAVNVNQNNAQVNIAAAETMEERMTRLRRKAQEHNALPPEVAAVPMNIDRDTIEGE